MKKDEKELDQISTTDKLKAMKTLKEAGLKVEFSSSGVPTVICASASDISKELRNVKRILKELRYQGSFGVRAPRKTDQGQIPEASENVEVQEADGEAVPA
jgi:hypothetical protein